MRRLFRHLAAQKQSIVPSFLMYIIPVAGGNGLPQKEHLFVLGNTWHYLIFLASRSVSLSVRMSPTLIGPFMLRVMIRPLSFPSRSLTRTCITSPVTPVLPITCVTSPGVGSSLDFSRAEDMSTLWPRCQT